MNRHTKLASVPTPSFTDKEDSMMHLNEQRIAKRPLPTRHVGTLRSMICRRIGRASFGVIVPAAAILTLFPGCALNNGSSLAALTGGPAPTTATVATPQTQAFQTTLNGQHVAAAPAVQTAAGGGAVSDNGQIRQVAAQSPYVARQFPETAPVNGAPPPTFAPGPPIDGGTFEGSFDNFGNVPNGGSPVVAGPRVREADLIVQGYPARTGRVTLGGAVNSDAGVTGQITIDERNFDIMRWPRSFQDLASGTAFRGAGQTFRLEAAPGNEFQRYTAMFADPNLLGYLPISMSVSGFLYDRRFNDWDEQRLGGRLSFGYRVSSFLSLTAGISGQSVDIRNPRVVGVQQLDDVVGDSHSLYSGEISLKHDTRNTPLQASEGHYFEFSFEEVFGDFDYARFEVEYRKYFLLNERVDGTGKQTLSFSTRAGFSGDETPIFENFFAGGYATMRGFDFRGASPVVGGVEVGGRFQFLNSVEYMFPLTADDAFRGVLFTDFGTVEQDVELNEENFRVAPGFGFRIAIPALGPAPLAFDFAFPVAQAATDEERMFSFYMSAVR